MTLSDREPTLRRLYTSQGAMMELELTEKGFKCYEAVIKKDGRRVCSGFGRSNEEATGNAARIALEAAVDSE